MNVVAIPPGVDPAVAQRLLLQSRAALSLVEFFGGTGVEILGLDDHGPEGAWVTFRCPNGKTGRVRSEPLL